MTAGASISQASPLADIKQVPQDAAVRQAIRELGEQLRPQLGHARALSWEQVHQLGQSLLAQLSLGPQFLGFAMVCVSNAFWRSAFEQVPLNRRLLLLPHCLSNRKACAGTYDTVGLNCADCGSCDISCLKRRAEALGYGVVVAEGTSSVLMKVLEGQADAVLGVACLDSLEKSFHRVIELGIPQIAVPLLCDGCVNTRAEIDLIQELLLRHAQGPQQSVRGYLPLLRQTTRMFAPEVLAALLAPHRTSDPHAAGPVWTEHVALDWLREGGKRLRPFITLATYAIARHGDGAFEPSVEEPGAIPISVQRAALAIEVLHKASLVHDDIEDNDEYRYGRQTLHREHGVGPAVNIGDYLIGLGYALIAAQSSALGGQCVADLLAKLAEAHLDLCRGQGAELAWPKRRANQLRAIDVLEIYALKTAPAFEVAFYSGLRMAGVECDRTVLRRFSACLGEAFQISNDLDDWRIDDRNKRAQGLDVLGERPTILRALAAEAGADTLADVLTQAAALPPAQAVDRVRQAYLQSGAFDKAQKLYGRLRQRALDDAGRFPTPQLQDLMRFLVRMMLPTEDRIDARPRR